MEVQSKGQSSKIIIHDEVYSVGHKHGKLYKLNSEPQHSRCYGSTAVNNDLQLRHNRYGHIRYDGLKLLYNKSMITGMSLKSNEAANKDCGAPHKYTFIGSFKTFSHFYQRFFTLYCNVYDNEQKRSS